MAFLGQRQRIDYPLIKNWRPLDKFQLRIQKTDIKTGVVNDQNRLANECQKFIYDLENKPVFLSKLAAHLGDASASRGTSRWGLMKVW